MICVSIQENNFPALLQALGSVSFAEIRLDHADFTEDQVNRIFSTDLTTIATCREGSKTDEQRIELLSHAIRAGADFVDLDVRNHPEFIGRIRRISIDCGCRLILSYHNYEACPSADELKEILRHCFDSGCDLAKIACLCRSKAESARLLSLYDAPEHAGKIISIGMGSSGRITRLASVFLGAPFTYASLQRGRETAEGQVDFKGLQSILEAMNSER